MPTKKQALQASVDEVAILYQKEHKFGDKAIRFTLDARDFQQTIDMYQTRLNVVRGIKTEESDFENIQHSDPVFDVEYKNLAGTPDEKRRIEFARRTAINHYIRLAKETYNWACWLALTKGQSFDNVPTPYEPIVEESLDGLGEPLPRPVPDISNPTEYRLKQLIDLFNLDFQMWLKIQEELRDATTLFEQRVKAGQLDGTTFRPAS